MKKFASLVVDKRYVIMGIMAVLCIVCAILTTKVTINKDMTKYLADSSQMKKGIDVMAEEFSDLSASNQYRVMFTDLKDDEKSDVAEFLKSIENIESVGYSADSESYNKDNYTLYEINTPYESDTDEGKAITSAIKEKYEGYDYTLEQTGSYAGLPTSLMITATVLLFVVLFSMCGSWFEPIVFLAVIGVAIILNLGTNIIKSSVSETTFSIASILQLVLSMDYSIILMNRYKQEKEKGNIKTEAMKNAIVNAFGSVTSSAVTTFVGLMMLVFMSFKIGADLGIVLAKGVLCSLVCVFTLLPAFIILSDKLIEKTKKKVLLIPTDPLASFSRKFRVPLAILFVVLFISAYFLQSKTAISFSQVTSNKISSIFPATNTTVVLYNTEDEDKIQAIVDGISDDEKVTSAISYPTLLAKKSTSEELSRQISALSSDVKLEPYMLNLIYYKYYNGDKLPDVKVADLINFIADDVATNEMFSDYIDETVTDNIGTMKKLADKATLTTSMDAQQLSEIFPIDADNLQKMFVLYYSTREGAALPTLTMNEFMSFLKNDILTNEQYSSMIDPEMASQIDKLDTFTDKSKITTPMTASEMAALMGTDESSLNAAFVLYKGIGKANNPISIYDLITFITSNRLLSSQMDEETLSQMTTLKAIMDGVISNKSLSYTDYAEIMGTDKSQMKQMFLLYVSTYGDTSDWRITPQQFIDFVISDVITNDEYASAIDEESVSYLGTAKTIIDAVVSDEKYSANQLESMLSGLSDSLDDNTLGLLLLYYGSQKDYDNSYRLSILEMFDFLSNNLIKDPAFDSILTDEMKQQISGMGGAMETAVSSLRRENHSMLTINTIYDDESQDTMDFMARLQKLSDDNLEKDHYLIGSSAMYYEMSQTFRHEMLFMTLLTAFSIFIIVLLSFRSFSIPTILVLLVQCAVYVTVAVSYVRGFAINYLAYLIVQCILMGSTIDYGILFTNYYREYREEKDIKESLKLAYRNSIHTILTSGLIMISLTGVIGMTSDDPTISPICLTISIGTLSAVLLILFVLPGMLAAFDKFTVKKKKLKRKI